MGTLIIVGAAIPLTITDTFEKTSQHFHAEVIQ